MNKTIINRPEFRVDYSDDPKLGGRYPVTDPELESDFPFSYAVSGCSPLEVFRTATYLTERTAPQELLSQLSMFPVQDLYRDEDGDLKSRYSIRMYWKGVRAVFLDDVRHPNRNGWPGAFWARRYKDFVAAVEAHDPEYVSCDMDLSGAWTFLSYEEEFGEPGRVEDIQDGAASIRWLLGYVEDKISTDLEYCIPQVHCHSGNPSSNQILQAEIDKIDRLRS